MELTLKEDKSIKSGFVLRVGTREFDWSEKGRIEQLENRIAKAVNSSRNTTFSEESIVSILKVLLMILNLSKRQGNWCCKLGW